MSAIARIVADRVNSISEVCFSKVSEGSLVFEINKIWKKKSGKVARSLIISKWKKTLKNEVEELLKVKASTFVDCLKEKITDESLPEEGCSENDHFKSTVIDESQLENQTAVTDNSDRIIFLNNFVILPVKSDGNCLFRCFSHYLQNTEDGHHNIRSNIVNSVCRDWETYSKQINLLSYDHFQDSKSYFKFMTKDGQFASLFEIFVFVKIYNISIQVYTPVDDRSLKMTAIFNKDGSTDVNQKHVKLLFTGSYKGGHYEVLKEKIVHSSNLDLNFDSCSGNNETMNIERNSNDKSVQQVPTIENFSDNDDNDINLFKQDFHSDSQNSSPYNIETDKIDENIVEPTHKKSEQPSEKNNFKCYLGRFTFYTNLAVTCDKDGCYYLNPDLLRSMVKTLMQNELHCYCPLSFYSGIKPYNGYFSAYAKCLVSSHKVRFKFDIRERNTDVLEIDANSTIPIVFTHAPTETPYTQVRGNQRKELMKLSLYNKARQLCLESGLNCNMQDLADGIKGDLLQEHVLEKIRSDAKNINRLTLKSKDLSDLSQLFIEEEHNSPDPFFRSLDYCFRVILFTEAQFDVVNPNRSAIVHLDSTGANIRNPGFRKQKRCYYYALVYRASKSTVPLAQMITSEHGIPSISKFLSDYKCANENSPKWPFKAVVVDWCWASMHSVVNVFNGITFSLYLEETYKYYCDKSCIPPKNFVYLLSCNAHIMHRVAIETKKFNLLHLKTFIMECMASLMLCREKQKMEELFELIVTILLTKCTKTAENNLKKLQQLIKNEKNGIEKIAEETTNSEPKEAEFTEFCFELFSNANAIFKQSPYYQYYYYRYCAIKTSLNESDLLETTNEYYAPDFVIYLLKSYMAFLPLWTAILMDLIDSKISRVTNAYVESHMKTYKNEILLGQKNLSIGWVIRALKKYNKCLIAKEKIFKICKDAEEIIKYPLYQEPAANVKVESEWAKTPKEVNELKIRKERNSYMSRKYIKKMSTDLIKKLENEENVNKKNNQKVNKRTTKSNVPISTIKKTQGQNKKTVLKPKTQTKLLKTNDLINNEDSEINEIKINESLTKVHWKNQLDNGLWDDPDFYKLSRSSFIIMATYSVKSNAVFALDSFVLTPREFYSLNGTEWINSQVIDSYATTYMNSWKGISYIPCELTREVLGDNWKKRKTCKRRIHKYTGPIGNMILMPYLYCGHWILLVVDISKKTLKLYDPFRVSFDERFLEAFTKFLNECDTKSEFSKLRKEQWKIKPAPEERPYQEDDYNCGVYIMHYTECLYKNIPFETEINTQETRNHIQKELLVNSEWLWDKCIYCGGKLSSEVNELKCCCCRRSIHARCIDKDRCTTDDEDESETTGSALKKRKYESLGSYNCRLCRRLPLK